MLDDNTLHYRSFFSPYLVVLLERKSKRNY